MNKADWIQLEEFILEHIKEIDPFARRSPGSGNKGRKGDIVSSCYLNIEAKQRNIKSPFDQKWLDKCLEEIPLHSQKIGIVVTENKDRDKVVHMAWNDFWKIYQDYCKYNNIGIYEND